MEPHSPEPEQMQVGWAWLTLEERQRRFNVKECMYYGSFFSFFSWRRWTLCPSLFSLPLSPHYQGKRPGPPVKQRILVGCSSFFTIPISLSMPPQLLIMSSYPCMLWQTPGPNKITSADLVKQLHIPTQTLDPPLRVVGITGQNITSIAHKEPSLQVIIPGNHQDSSNIFCFLFSYPVSFTLEWFLLKELFEMQFHTPCVCK